LPRSGAGRQVQHHAVEAVKGTLAVKVQVHVNSPVVVRDEDARHVGHIHAVKRLEEWKVLGVVLGRKREQLVVVVHAKLVVAVYCLAAVAPANRLGRG
jgi:hypothetical protein